MASPSSRQNLVDYCLRKLGHPVLEINIDDDQIEDRIDEAFQFYRDFHFDATEKTYKKVLIEPSLLKLLVSMLPISPMVRLLQGVHQVLPLVFLVIKLPIK